MSSDQFSGANGSLNQEILHWSVLSPWAFPHCISQGPRFPKLPHAPDSTSGQHHSAACLHQYPLLPLQGPASGDSRYLEPTHVLAAPWQASHSLTSHHCHKEGTKVRFHPSALRNHPLLSASQTLLCFSQIQYKMINFLIFRISTELPNLMK